MDKRKLRRIFIFYKPVVLLALLLFWPSVGQTIENSECMECHSDDSLVRDESEGMKENLFVNYHNFKISVHNINEIGCVDCHSDIEELDYDNDVPHKSSLAAVDCDGCHEEEGEAYVDSVHKKAGGKGISIPCYACHDYHYVTHLEANSVFERENAFCLRCHNPNHYHDWLPQKDAHFAFVECAVCHAPEVPRHVALRFFDLIQNKFLTGDEFLKALNTDYDGFMPMVDRDGDGIIGLREFEDIVILLRQKDVRGTFHGEVIVSMEPAVHHINRGGASQECEQCHNPNSPFFEDVKICLNKEDGTTQQSSVERRVLESYYVKHFYALSGTRVRFLDKIGIALLAGGFSVVAGHLTARIVTAPTRRRRKEKDKRTKK